MQSLREQQSRLAEAILGTADAVLPVDFFSQDNAVRRISIYRNNFRSNYRNALGASYPVVCRVVGKAFFDAAVDAFVQARPSASGDLNIYGSDFGDFLMTYPYATDLPYLGDVARLEWAIDEAQRAPDCERGAGEVLSALGAIDPDFLSSITIGLDPSCRLVASPFPLLQIWRVNQPSCGGDARVDLGEGGDRLRVRRDAGTVGIERLDAGTFAFLRQIQSGSSLGEAFEAAQQANSTFDLAAALSGHIGAGTIAFIGPPHCQVIPPSRDQCASFTPKENRHAS
jgi:hypothetical protein